MLNRVAIIKPPDGEIKTKFGKKINIAVIASSKKLNNKIGIFIRMASWGLVQSVLGIFLSKPIPNKAVLIKRVLVGISAKRIMTLCVTKKTKKKLINNNGRCIR